VCVCVCVCVWISPYVYGYILLTTRYGADVSGEGEGVLGTTLKHPPSPKSALLTETWYVLMQISQLLAVSLCLSLFLSKSSQLLLLCPPPVSLFLRTNDILHVHVLIQTCVILIQNMSGSFTHVICVVTYKHKRIQNMAVLIRVRVCVCVCVPHT
jgi:hypothetical protein